MSGRRWFRSRKCGRGWQGRLLAIAALAVTGAAGFVFEADGLGIVIALTCLAALAVILFFTGGPGR